MISWNIPKIVAWQYPPPFRDVTAGENALFLGTPKSGHRHRAAVENLEGPSTLCEQREWFNSIFLELQPFRAALKSQILPPIATLLYLSKTNMASKVGCSNCRRAGIDRHGVEDEKPWEKLFNSDKRPLQHRRQPEIQRSQCWASRLGLALNSADSGVGQSK